MSNSLDELIEINNNTSQSLLQGINFNKYQNKYNKNIEGLAVLTDNPSYKPITTTPTEAEDKIRKANQTEYDDLKGKIIKHQNIYNKILKDYNILSKKISDNRENYLKRTTNNRYFGKNIRFNTKQVCYVTEQGVVKQIPESILYSIAGKNGCPGKNDYINVNVKYPESNIPGTFIPELNLILGTPMKYGESCGNAGKNVFVNTLTNNPEEKYLGCYNDRAPSSDILFVPVMNNSNNLNGFKTYASSVYGDDNNKYGPWTAFDRKDSTYWHSKIAESFRYNSNTGVYTGITKTDNVITKNGTQTIKGENIQVNLPKNYILTKYELKGRQDSGNPNGRSPNSWIIVGWNGSSWNEVDKKENQALNSEMRTYYISNPKSYNSYRMIITNCGNPNNRDGNRYCVQISIWNLYTSSDYSDSQPAMILDTSVINYTDFNTCKSYAIQKGYKYFGMQDLKSDGKAQCLFSNDSAKSTQYGIGKNYKPVVLWQTNTGGGKGSNALLNNQGSLVVNDSGGAAIYATPGYKSTSGNYIGCYGDTSNRAMQNTSNGAYLPFDDCKKLAQKGNFKYFSTQNASNGKGWCAASNDLNFAKKYGIATNCSKFGNDWMGAPWSNAIYSIEPDNRFFLVLKDDGNMVVYKGTSPIDNQGLVWATGTNGKKKSPNPNFTAKKSKFGTNWISMGTTLAAGDFIGSNDGSMYLLMQTDGNLVLYTSESFDGCTANSSGKKIGGQRINALYEIVNSGFDKNIGKLAFIDENDLLHEYPSSNSSLTNNYTKFSKMDAYNNDISGASYSNSTKEQCQTTCNNNQNCYGYVYDYKNKVCYPKSSKMWPNGGPIRSLISTDTYVRDKTPNSFPLGVTKKTKNIDSVLYQYYYKGDAPGEKYGLANISISDKNDLKNLQNQLNDQTTELKILSKKLTSLVEKNQDLAKMNIENTTKYLTDIQNINSQMETLNSKKDTEDYNEGFTNYGYTANNDINKILGDSNISVLQKNYEYLLWTILATGSVLVAMNITKN